MEMRDLIIPAVSIPLGAFMLFLAGRLFGWGWAMSWFQAKNKYEQENKERKNDTDTEGGGNPAR